MTTTLNTATLSIDAAQMLEQMGDNPVFQKAIATGLAAYIAQDVRLSIGKEMVTGKIDQSLVSQIECGVQQLESLVGKAEAQRLIDQEIDNLKNGPTMQEIFLPAQA